MPDEKKICFDRVIPERVDPAKAIRYRVALSRYVAAVQAKSGAPKTASFGEHIQKIGPLPDLNANDPARTARMALIDLKKWEDGHDLRCRFLDGDDTQQQKVIEKAKLWEQYARITISFVDDADAEVRISFSADTGSWSAIGSDCLNTNYFPVYQPTMNFGWLKDDTEDQEYERVVVHEFGHALGCIHEHQSPAEKLSWDTAAVYAAFSGPPNFWSKDEINQNILQKYSPQGLTYTQFDPDSIMLYQFDASLFTDHKPTKLNTQLSDSDKKMIGEMYPPAAGAVRKVA